MTPTTTDKISQLRSEIKIYILEVINFARQIPKDEIGRIFINQLIKSVTSIGANFEESTEAESSNDIVHKMSIVKKEAKETKYWIDLAAECFPQLKTPAADLLEKTQKWIKVFSTIISKKKESH